MILFEYTVFDFALHRQSVSVYSYLLRQYKAYLDGSDVVCNGQRPAFLRLNDDEAAPTLIEKAIRLNRPDHLKSLLIYDTEHALLKEEDYRYRARLLMMACEMRNTDCVVVILENYKDLSFLNAKNINGQTVLHLLLTKHWLSCSYVENILNLDVNGCIDFYQTDAQGRSLLMCALLSGVLASVELLSKKVYLHKMLSMKAENGCNALMMAAASGSLACIKFVLDKINNDEMLYEKDKNGYTVVSYLAQGIDGFFLKDIEEREAVCLSFMEKDPDNKYYHVTHREEMSFALMAFIKNKFNRCLKMILARDCEKIHFQAFSGELNGAMLAALYCNLEGLSLFLNDDNLYYQSKTEKKTVLSAAVGGGDVACVQLVLEKDTDKKLLFLTDVLGRTAFHMAKDLSALEGKTHPVESILAKAMDLHQRS